MQCPICKKAILTTLGYCPRCKARTLEVPELKMNLRTMTSVKFRAQFTEEEWEQLQKLMQATTDLFLTVACRKVLEDEAGAGE